MGIEKMFDNSNDEVKDEVDSTVENQDVVETPEAEDTQDTTQEEAKVREDKGHTVPLSEYLNTRDELKELKRWKQEQERQAQQHRENEERQKNIPTSESSAYEIAQWQHNEFNRALRDERLHTSKMYAEQIHGVDVVKAAADWAIAKSEGPEGQIFDYQFDQQRDPIGWVVAQYQRDQKINSYLSDEEAFFKANAEKYGFVPAGTSAPNVGVNDGVAQATTANNQAATQPTKLPGSSLNNITSAAGGREAGKTSSIDRLFK